MSTLKTLDPVYFFGLEFEYAANFELQTCRNAMRHTILVFV